MCKSAVTTFPSVPADVFPFSTNYFNDFITLFTRCINYHNLTPEISSLFWHRSSSTPLFVWLASYLSAYLWRTSSPCPWCHSHLSSLPIVSALSVWLNCCLRESTFISIWVVAIGCSVRWCRISELGSVWDRKDTWCNWKFNDYFLYGLWNLHTLDPSQIFPAHKWNKFCSGPPLCFITPLAIMKICQWSFLRIFQQWPWCW